MLSDQQGPSPSLFLLSDWESLSVVGFFGFLEVFLLLLF